MRNYSTALKIAPAFLLAGILVHAQQDSTKKENKIEEVVLIGYGKQKKTDVTGSITSVTAKNFNGGATSPAQLIQGRTPGVQVVTNSGAPGSGATIRIRGTASLNGNNSPLIVIDGVPQDFTKIAGASDPLSLINPNDIETFDILKDASSTAIYGNRASNGVILITTKKGTSGKFRVNLSTVASVSQKIGNVNVMDADAFRDFVKAHAPTNPNYQAMLGNADTNWQDLIYQTAWGTDNNLAFSGGIKNLPYRLSLGYNEQNGIVKTNSFRRTSLGLNLNPKFLQNHLAVNVNLKGTFTDNRFPDSGVIGSALRFDPTQPVYSGNSAFGGYYEWVDANAQNGYNNNSTSNPVALLNGIHDVSSIWRGLGNIQLDYKVHFLPDLHINVNTGYDYAKSYGRKTVNALYRAGVSSGGSESIYGTEKKNKLFETYLNYVKKVNAINTTLDLTAGYAYQDFFTHVNAPENYVGNPAPGYNPFGKVFETQNTLLSYYGRAIFTIANKYIISASMRRDGSSRFYNGTRNNLWGNFPGVSVAWKINEESFLKDVTAINTLKLRAGWGKTGQQELGRDYPSFASYNLSSTGAQYQFGNAYYYMYRPDIYNPNLKWETTTTKNLGLDYGFAHNRIYGAIDIFQKDTEGLLVDVGIPAGDLSNHNLLNIGNMENKGIEGSITFVPVKNANTTWEVGFNATHYKPIITKLQAAADDSYFIPLGDITGATGNYIQAHAVGYSPSSFLVYQQVYDANGKPMDGVYADRNHDGVIDAKDKYYDKSTTPDAILGFNTRLSYKNWDFSASARAVLGNYVYNNMASNSAYTSVSTNNYLQNIFVSDTTFANKQFFSDMYVEKADFFRLDNVNIGYTIPNFISSGNTLKIYGLLQNVFTISDYSGVDPEISGGIDNAYYQMPKVYSLGFNFQF